MHYKHIIFLIVSALCSMSGAYASHTSKMCEVEITIASKFNREGVSKRIELSDDDYNDMCLMKKNWICTYFNMRAEAIEDFCLDRNTLAINIPDNFELHREYYRLLESLINNTFAWWDTCIEWADFNPLITNYYCDEAYKQIDSEFARACIRAEIKKRPATFNDAAQLKKMIERNEIVQRDNSRSKEVKEVWNTLVEQACVCQHDQVREIVLRIAGGAPLTPHDILLCTCIGEQKVGKQMIQSTMRELTSDQMSAVDQFVRNVQEGESGGALGKLLEEVKENLPKKDTAAHKFLFESRISMLNKKFIVPAGVCAITALIYGIYRYMHTTNNNAHTHENVKSNYSADTVIAKK